MRQYRLFVESTPVVGTELQVGPEAAQYIGKALRMRVGESLTVFDGTGGSFDANILSIERRSAQLDIVSFNNAEVESPLRLNLLQAISRGERMDFVIQKATELGVDEIQPVFTEFGGVRLNAQRSASRHAHWIGIANNACQQCGRNRVPKIAEPQEFVAALENLSDADLSLILDPRGSSSGIKGTPASINVAVGPEGGFSETEIEIATERGFQRMTLGPRILRTETAALASLSVLQAKYGDFGL